MAHNLESRLTHACHGASARLNSCKKGACKTEGPLIALVLFSCLGGRNVGKMWLLQPAVYLAASSSMQLYRCGLSIIRVCAALEDSA